MKQRIYEIDFIRAAALLTIIFFHYLESGILALGLLQNPEHFTFHGISLLHLGGVNLALGNWGVSLFLIISGASLMYVYENGLEVKTFYKKRVRAMMPLYWLAFSVAFVVQFMICGGLNWTEAEAWTLILTFLGLDGWLSEVIPNFALVGDWYVGAILIIYLFFPLFYKCIKKHPHITIFVYAIIFLIWEFWFPFDFPKRNSVILRGFEVVLGMYFMEKWRKVTLPVCLISCGIIAALVFVKIEIISLYVLVPIAGGSAFLVLFYLAAHFRANCIQKFTRWICTYSYSVFLIHHFIMNRFFERIRPQSLGIGAALISFFVILSIIIMAGYILKKTESFLFYTANYVRKILS